MPTAKYKPNEGHFKVLECKQCGTQIKVLPGQTRIFKVRCRSCGGSRFRVIL